MNNWKDTWDEVAIGLFIAIISCLAVWKMGKEAVPIVTGAIGALGVYLGAKNKPS